MVKKAFASAHLLEILNCDFELIHRIAISKAAHKNLTVELLGPEKLFWYAMYVLKASKHKKNELAKATKIYKKALKTEQKRQQAGLNAKKKVWKNLFTEARLYMAARKKLR